MQFKHKKDEKESTKLKTELACFANKTFVESTWLHDIPGNLCLDPAGLHGHLQVERLMRDDHRSRGAEGDRGTG